MQRELSLVVRDGDQNNTDTVTKVSLGEWYNSPEEYIKTLNAPSEKRHAHISRAVQYNGFEIGRYCPTCNCFVVSKVLGGVAIKLSTLLIHQLVKIKIENGVEQVDTCDSHGCIRADMDTCPNLVFCVLTQRQSCPKIHHSKVMEPSRTTLDIRNGIHIFDENGICLFCKIQQCTAFLKVKVKDCILEFTGLVHNFKDGICTMCGGVQCLNNRIHTCGCGNSCQYCGHEMCSDGLHVHTPKNSCPICMKDITAKDPSDKCLGKGAHKAIEKTEICEVCGLELCCDNHYGHILSADGLSCTRCNNGLCSDQRKHVWKSEEGSDQMFCIKCGKARCTKGIANDNHRFEEDVCTKCGIRKCPCLKDGVCEFQERKLTEVVPNSENPNERTLVIKVRQCIHCKHVLLEKDGPDHIEQVQNGIRYCKNCHKEMGSDNHVHIFDGVTRKCHFCEASYCRDVQIDNNGNRVYTCHKQDGDHCSQCEQRLCVDAYCECDNHIPVLTVCSNDGDGRCQTCRIGVCINGQDHQFENNSDICKVCEGGKCRSYRGSEYCHSNHNGVCIYCGTQLCNGKNCGHRFTEKDGCNVCTVCEMEECSSKKGFVHSPTVFGCCRICNKEMCVDGKHTHHLNKMKIERGNESTEIEICSLCHNQKCPLPEGGDGCHISGRDNRCIKCQKYMCFHKKRYADNTSFIEHILKNSTCLICDMGVCREDGTNLRVHNVHSFFSKCSLCNKEICSSGGHHDFTPVKKNGMDLMICKYCHREECPSLKDHTHKFDSYGQCTECKKFQCYEGQVHMFVEQCVFNPDENPDFKMELCAFCHCQKCKEQDDICHFTCVAQNTETWTSGDVTLTVSFCPKCHSVGCNLPSTEQIFSVPVRTHRHEYDDGRCLFCSQEIDFFTKSYEQWHKDQNTEDAKLLYTYIENGYSHIAPGSDDALRNAELSVTYLKASAQETAGLYDTLERNPIAKHQKAKLIADVEQKKALLKESMNSGYIKAGFELLPLVNNEEECGAIIQQIFTRDHGENDWEEAIGACINRPAIVTSIISHLVHVRKDLAIEMFRSYYDKLSASRSSLAPYGFKHGVYEMLLHHGKELLKASNENEKIWGMKCIADAVSMLGGEDDLIKSVAEQGSPECKFMWGSRHPDSGGLEMIRASVYDGNPQGFYWLQRQFRCDKLNEKVLSVYTEILLSRLEKCTPDVVMHYLESISKVLETYSNDSLVILKARVDIKKLEAKKSNDKQKALYEKYENEDKYWSSAHPEETSEFKALIDRLADMGKTQNDRNAFAQLEERAMNGDVYAAEKCAEIIDKHPSPENDISLLSKLINVFSLKPNGRTVVQRLKDQQNQLQRLIELDSQAQADAQAQPQAQTDAQAQP